ncbi:hypothetical protein [Nonomuraea sp. NPDC050786]|uniref:hypothetical protein n=1 Tax=Nonomuraea sp. NPDC050786 TaxID=3154840 RepID=UPI0033C1E1B4
MMQPPARRPGSPSAALLAGLAGLGAGTWLLSLANQGVAAFVTAIICLALGAGAGLTAGFFIGDLRRLERTDRLKDAYDNLYEHARQSQITQHQTARQLAELERDLRDAQTELAALRDQNSTPAKEGDPQ